MVSVAVQARQSWPPPEWNRPFEAFRIAGPIHYVGTEDLAAYLITTPRGHILVDGALREGIVPPTINLDDPDEGCDLDYVANASRPLAIRYALSNSFGFGGTNGTLLFKRYEE